MMVAKIWKAGVGTTAAGRSCPVSLDTKVRRVTWKA